MVIRPCGLCPKVFRTRVGLYQHKLSHAAGNARVKYEGECVPRRWTCKRCPSIFQTRSGFRRHQMKHTGIGLHVCIICDARFVERGKLVAHMSHHGAEKKYHCMTCNMRFTSNHALKRHALSHEANMEPDNVCFICGKSFLRKDYVTEHMRRVHTKKESEDCRDDTKDEIKQPSTYPCDVCPKVLKNPSSLRKHKLLHEGKGKYQCEDCGKQYIERLTFLAHKLHHGKGERFTCSTCSKTFAANSSLVRHELSHVDPQHVCSVCGKQYTRLDALTDHVNCAHTDQKSYHCDHCGTQFGWPANARRHAKVCKSNPANRDRADG